MAVVLSRKGGGAAGAGGAPSGPAGGVLGGTYPNPSFAADMATQAELTTAVAALLPGSTLFDSTLGGDTASIDTGANGIAQTAAHLLIIVYSRTTEVAVSSTARLTFNNDSGANYDSQQIRNINTTISGPLALAQTFLTVNTLGASAQAGAFGSAVLFVPNYRGTAGHKSILSLYVRIEDTAADAQTLVTGGRYISTSAISRAALASGSGNLLTGSRLSIYGIG